MTPGVGHLYKGVKMLTGRLDIAALGAVASTSVFLGGAATPFVNTTTGTYTLTLNEAVVGPAFPLLTMLKSTEEDLKCEVSANTLTTAASPVLTILTTKSSTTTGAAVAPTNACSIYVHLVLPDSQAN